MKYGFQTTLVFLLSVAVSAAALTEDFSRYQVILDRKPFGEPPADPGIVAASNVQAQATEQFLKSLRLCSVKVETNGKLRAGFVNQAAANRSYYLYVGETSDDGIEVVDVNLQDSSAMIKRGADSGWITMGAAPTVAAGGPLPPGAPAAMMPGRGTSIKPVKRETYSEIMKRRMEERQKILEMRSSAKPALTGEDLEKHLKDYQMEVIRKGMPALPIPLTKEMDDQLVKEGVLPPQPGQEGPAQPAEVPAQPQDVAPVQQ